MFARRGTPATLSVDGGTNMGSVSFWFVEDQRNELSEEYTKVFLPMGVLWVLTSGDTPHRNELSDGAVKLIKRCLQKSAGRVILSFPEIKA
jgi:hypothetical protein